MEKTVWKPIKGYETQYQINEYGLIINRYGHELSPHHDKDGYLRVDLYKDNHRKKFGVHQLVALNFVSGQFPGAVVNHKDENKWNNHYSNLEWITSKQNTNYGLGIRRRSITQGKRVAQMTRDGTIIATFLTSSEAEKATGVKRNHISMAATGKVKTAKGFRWKYV